MSRTASVNIRTSIDYSEIECLGSPSVAGHGGVASLAECENKELLIFNGRRHWYEGDGWESVVFPAYACIRIGIPALVLTNAAGGIRHDFHPGDVMVIDDHINAMGASPLSGPHNPLFGPRFPDQSDVYDRAFAAMFDKAASLSGHPARHGIYAAVAGPTYETPAEIEALRRLGADAVGMSTVPEAMLAHAAGIRVTAVSCITNPAACMNGPKLSHDEVIRETREAGPVLQAILARFISLLLLG